MILLGSSDMAKLGCGGCNGCSECCRGMGQSILLDPYDLFQLQTATGQDFACFMQEKIELCVENGIILPAMRMQPESDACGFLNREGRCSIHRYRPGLCRLFPLGRNYGDAGLRYFMLEDACKVQNRTKVKIKKWLGIPELARYEHFLTVWHDLRKDAQERIMNRQSDDFARDINVKFLELFYKKPYDTEGNFYEQFEERRAAVHKLTDGWTE